jgi:hypothetical protein
LNAAIDSVRNLLSYRPRSPTIGLTAYQLLIIV